MDGVQQWFAVLKSSLSVRYPARYALLARSCTNVSRSRSTCRYLNQQHIKKQKLNEAEAVYGCSNHGDNQEKMEIGELTLEIWNQYMIQRLGNELVDQILSGINAERVNNSSGQHNKSTEVIRGVIQSFVAVQEDRRKGSLKLYQELFETRMLEESGQNFRIVASELLQVREGQLKKMLTQHIKHCFSGCFSGVQRKSIYGKNNQKV